MDAAALDEILLRLDSAKQRKTQIAIAKANAELESLKRQATSYFDGAYDALNEVKKLLAEEET